MGVYLLPFTEQTQLLAHQVALHADNMVAPYLTLRKADTVVRNNGSQTRLHQFDPRLCCLLAM